AKFVATNSAVKVTKSEKAVSSSMIFQTKPSRISSFFALPLTTETMGIGGLREHSLSCNDK
ncbi:MAG: hypothetical protein PHS59_17055, partial [Paludibacter sp.]|nr:hypothetical protein [Paludibacter sp.]